LIFTSTVGGIVWWSNFTFHEWKRILAAAGLILPPEPGKPCASARQ
jgi:hypothetical protein